MSSKEAFDNSISSSHSEPFADAKLLLDHAIRHIDDLEASIDRFGSRDAWKTIAEPNLEKTEYEHKLRVLRVSDPKSKMIARYAANDLKDALDHVAAECGRLSNPQPIKGIVLPFRGSAKRLDERFDRHPMTRLPPEVRAYLRALDTYKGGNDRLYVLSMLSGANKHWKLIPVFSDIRAVKVIHPDGWQKLVQTDNWPTSPKDDLALFTSNRPDEHYYLSFLVTVRFDGVPGFEKSSPVPTFRHIASVVNNVINDCEAICQRLGLLER